MVEKSVAGITVAVCLVFVSPASAEFISIGVGYGEVGGGLDPVGTPFTVLGTAWDPGANTARVGGDPAPGGASWSVMGTGITDSSGFDLHGSTSDLTALYAGGVDEVTTIGLALDSWAAVSGFTNRGMVGDSGAGFGSAEAAGGHVGDIRVGATTGFSPGVLSHTFQPGTESLFGPGGTIAGDTHINSSFLWADNDSAGFDFLTVVLHELGHSLGLGHSGTSGSIMEPFYAGARRTLHADDIAGITSIYGAPTAVPEPSTLFQLGVGLGAVAYRRRHKG